MIDHALLRRLRTPIPLEGEPANIAALPQWMVSLSMARRPKSLQNWWVATLSDAGGAYLEVVEELAELRLTLAAEQGRPEGAPSEGWTYTTGFYERWEKGKAVVQTMPPLGWRWRIGRRKFRDAATARAAMLAADKANNPPTTK